MPKRYIWLIIISLCLPMPAWAVKKLGQTGFKWLSIPVGARAIGMGSAFTPIDGELTAAFWNPAGLNGVESPGVTMVNTAWIADINHTAVAGAWDFGAIGVVGLNMINVDYGDIKGTIRSENEQGFLDIGTYSPEAMMIGLTYGRQISSKFTFGANFKYCYEDLGSGYISSETDTTGMTKISNDLSISAFDIGTLFYPGFKDLRLGMTLQNFSQEKEYIDESFPLPLTFRFGMAMDLLQLVEADDQRLTLVVDLIHPRDYTERIHYGIEYEILESISVRAGYKQNYDEEDFSGGVGLKQDFGPVQIQFDYAYNNFNHFDGIHIITFGISRAK